MTTTVKVKLISAGQHNQDRTKATIMWLLTRLNLSNWIDSSAFHQPSTIQYTFTMGLTEVWNVSDPINFQDIIGALDSLKEINATVY